MQQKEIVYIALGAVLLTNVSILGTLYATGILGADPVSEEATKLALAAEQEKQVELAFAVPEPVSRVNYLHTLAEAMYICEERLTSNNENILKSYSFDHQASRYMEDGDIFFVFIELVTVGTIDSPGKTGDIYCEVEPSTKAIVNYQMVMREE